MFESDPLDGFADPLVLKTVIGPPIDDALAEGDKGSDVFIRSIFINGTITVPPIARPSRCFTAEQNGSPSSLTRRQGLGHDIDAVHAMHTVAVVKHRSESLSEMAGWDSG
jgi:hypothetical protein